MSSCIWIDRGTHMKLPEFKYHPNPVKSGSIERSKVKCVCCGNGRWYIYAGPVFAEEELFDQICPWYIADGSAHKKFDASFVDEDGIGDYGTWDAASDKVVREIAYRTPGFCGWQQERWWTHCGDGAEFIGRVGYKEARKAGEAFLTAIRAEAGMTKDAQWKEYLKALKRDGSPTAYLFRC